jgi:hypothetical protein
MLKYILKKIFPVWFIKTMSKKFNERRINKVNESNAITFQDKIKLRIKKSSIPDIGKRMAMYADKYKVRAYVSDKVGDRYLVKLLSTCDTLTEDIWNSLPSRFVIKTNFGTGPRHYHIVKNKSDEDLDLLKKKFSLAMLDDWYLGTYEMAYSFIERKIIVEEYLPGLDGMTSPDDYKIHCFKSKSCEIEFLTQIDRGRFEGIHRNFYDENFSLLNFNYGGAENFEFKVSEYESIILEMHRLAALLLGELTYARVDFYYINKRIYFGEITHTHTAGNALFTPDKANHFLGDKIKQNEVFCNY